MKIEAALPSVGKTISRRKFVKLAAAVIALPELARSAIFGSQGTASEDKFLNFYSIHTGESLSATYFRSGQLLPAALQKINHILRDYRTGEVREIDIRLLDLLERLARELRCSQPFHVISGYRSKQTNDYLRRIGGGVAAGSLHMAGQAIDIRVPGCALFTLRQTALSLKAGGVGYYPKPDFVHVDIGRVRCW